MLLSDRRNSLLEAQQAEPEKQKMPDEFTSASGYHRKCRHGATATHAIGILKNQV